MNILGSDGGMMLISGKSVGFYPVNSVLSGFSCLIMIQQSSRGQEN
jgi:hypothetical protein